MWTRPTALVRSITKLSNDESHRVQEQLLLKRKKKQQEKLLVSVGSPHDKLNDFLFPQEIHKVNCVWGLGGFIKTNTALCGSSSCCSLKLEVKEVVDIKWWIKWLLCLQKHRRLCFQQNVKVLSNLQLLELPLRVWPLLLYKSKNTIFLPKPPIYFMRSATNVLELKHKMTSLEWKGTFILRFLQQLRGNPSYPVCQKDGCQQTTPRSSSWNGNINLSTKYSHQIQ